MRHSPGFLFDFHILFTCSWLNRQPNHPLCSPHWFPDWMALEMPRLLAQAVASDRTAMHPESTVVCHSAKDSSFAHTPQHPRQSDSHHPSRRHLPKSSSNLEPPSSSFFFVVPSTLCCVPTLALPRIAATKTNHTDNSVTYNRPRPIQPRQIERNHRLG